MAVITVVPTDTPTTITETGFRLLHSVPGVFTTEHLINKLLDVNIPEEKWDLYGTLLLGYEMYTVTWGDDRFRQEGYSAGGFVPGLVFGTRYFSPEVWRIPGTWPWHIRCCLHWYLRQVLVSF